MKPELLKQRTEIQDCYLYAKVYNPNKVHYYEDLLTNFDRLNKIFTPEIGDYINNGMFQGYIIKIKGEQFTILTPLGYQHKVKGLKSSDVVFKYEYLPRAERNFLADYI